MKKFKLMILATVVPLLSACAEQQQSQQAYVSPQEFKRYNCKQISKEMNYTREQYMQSIGQNENGALIQAALSAYMVSQRYAFTSGGNQNPQAE